MNRSNIYNKVKSTRRWALCGLLLWMFAGSTMAQSDPMYVIMKDGNYLAHVVSGSTATLQNATAFNPVTCIWYSGPNVGYNYYFIDGDGNYRYLSAPLSLNGQLGLSASHPGTVVLNKTTENYYFYDWDHGLARGIQLDMSECENHPEYNGIEGNQCWKVVWLSYEGNTWKMSSQYGYDPTPNSARFYSVSVTEHSVQITSQSGGIPDIADFAMSYGDAPHSLYGTAQPFTCTYTPAYTTYVFNGATHNYYNGSDHGTTVPGSSTLNGATPSYAWTLTGEGAEYLSLSATDIPDPTLSYHTPNTTTSHKMATLTLTATYQGGVTQVETITVTVKTQCQNPVQASAPVVTYEDVTVSWVPTADKYALSWKKHSETTWPTANLVQDITATSYTFTGEVFSNLVPDTQYDYRVSAFCGGAYQNVPESLVYHFTTHAEADVIILGAVYGGGRMANVNGSTEVVVVNCDSVNAVYGGNDIAGVVSGGSNIVLGVDASSTSTSYSHLYNNNQASTKVRVFDVYGGGNGYYAYNGTNFVAASSDYNSQTVPANGQVLAMTPSGVGNAVWTNEADTDVNLTFPKITNTVITMTNNAVKVDSVFGGAKNAFLTTNSGYGSDITVNGGTAYAVFGGNNIGGGQGYGKHHIVVNGTKTNLTANTGFGRNFGIGYLFGGGNKVYGSTTEITIAGGQCDTVFAGGNSASVYAANVTVNCPMGSGSGSTFGSVYTNAITGYTAGTSPTLTMNDSYPWDGTGVYNVRTLFGGNNRAMMTCLPNITLTSGSLGTVYGGGNAGDMMAQTTGGSIPFAAELDMESFNFDYSTKLVVNSPTVLVDNLYGGCQMSNVGYSTWLKFMNGHAGTVYGGCNISGDVGSTRKDLTQPITNPGGLYQEVYGATYVELSGGTVHKDVFAGGNGFYHCVNGLGTYVSGITYDPAGHSYVGMKAPTHNETHVVLYDGVTINNNVYAGGNLAPVGFTHAYVAGSPYAYPEYVGLASVCMLGGEVKGDVYGGGRMASINGNNEVRVDGGSIGTGPNGGALYGGNDRLGKAGGISNRVLPESYNTASDNLTPLMTVDAKVNTYIGVTGNPRINTIYGGGNGAYQYSGPGADMQYCDTTDKPIQSNIFVDIAIDGGAGPHGAGYIENVFGGGNGVYTDGFVKVFFNAKHLAANDGDHIGNLYGGNNMGDMDTIPDIILLHGNVHTVYGGCNSGAMTGNRSYTGSDGTVYNNVGSLVHLRDSYTAGGVTVHPDAKVTGAVYGGCRMNGVAQNSLVLVERGNHSADFFGGSDISGDISGISQVIVKGGTTGSIYGGGNGNYSYTGTLAGLTAPTCATSQVNILGGQVGTDADHTANVYGGGLGAGTSTIGNVDVTVNSSSASIWGDVYGGSALGNVNTSSSNHTNVTLASGTIHGDLYGGGHGDSSTLGEGHSNVAAQVNGAVQVTVNGGSVTGSVYGCNNVNGAPQSTVNVDIYGTDMPATGYALGKVFGGGNQAAYTGTPEVTIHNCNNKIEYVYGGGNAANVNGTDVTVYGGNTIGNVFGGCYGANVTTDGTDVKIHGGTIGEVYGGNNASGTVTGTINVNVNKQAEDPNGTACAMHINEVYGGGNLADSQAGNITIGCTGAGDTEGIGDLYGGANQANITSGDIVLNINQGRINRVFGGNNTSGSISGGITVNINKAENPCVWDINDVFGGGNLAVYGGVPQVNVMNGIVANVYGGGNGNPSDPTQVPGQVAGSLVTIGDSETNHTAIVTDNVYGGGNAAKVSGNTHVVYNDNNTSSSVSNLFGGGNQAGVTGTATVDMTNGKVSTGIYGGCNTTGDVAGAIAVNVKGGTLGVDENHGINIHGGGYGQPTTTGGDVTVTIGGDNTTPIIYGAVYGGSALGGVNADTTNLTKVWLKSGTVNGRVYGGGLGDKASLGTGHSDIAAAVNGKVQVINDGVDVTTAIYGCNNLNGGPAGKVAVTLNNGTVKNVVGGGNLAAYTAPSGVDSPVLNITGGEVTHKVVGGGNAANVTGNPKINISNGILCSSNDYDNVGIYGGCNESGIVNGNITLNITGDDTHQTTIGTAGALNTKKPVKVFGGGYGPGTSTTGNVTVNYGKINGENAYQYPMLYGDLYGGSALGEVNSDGDDQTTVNILNGSFKYTSEIVAQEEKQYGGSIYGGGLGDRANNHPAKVNGEVHVNIGSRSGDNLLGMADLVHCNVYGCNNVFGSPQHNVFVDIYNTKRTAGLNTVDDLDFAALSVFGGGNLANYLPLVTTEKTHVYIHGCENTVRYVYGGGNAADAYGVETIIEGGHFDEVFGGGNGLVSPANIGAGGVGIVAFGGHVNFLYEGSNKQGVNAGPTYYPSQPASGFIDCGDLFVDSYFFGDNEAEHLGDLNNTITCAQAGDFHYKYVYAGSRYAIIYGDVNLTVRGGYIENLFGGSRGYDLFPADIRKYPTLQQIQDAPAGYYSPAVIAAVNANHDLQGTGGDINLIIEGGTVGNVFGGCDVNGNVEGKITVTVNANDTVQANCPLHVGNVYGASNLTEYLPTGSSNADSPDVKIFNGTVGGSFQFRPNTPLVDFEGNVFGGGNQGKVTSNPKVTVGYTDSSKSATVFGSVYGAGNRAKVTGNTNVILQGNADIRTNVFGGGKSADVEGSTNVILKEQ